jgi:hypothetical protein
MQLGTYLNWQIRAPSSRVLRTLAKEWAFSRLLDV